MSCACANFRLKLENISLMFSSLNSANSKWRVAEDPGIVGKEVILDEKGNTKSKVTAGKTTMEFT